MGYSLMPKLAVIKIVVIALCGSILGLAFYIWLASSWAYSTGERVGYIQKFSHKGWICKTWEGEMVLQTSPGSLAEKFFFTTKDENIIKMTNQNIGKKITLGYEQHKGLPTSCFGDTEYFVVKINALDK